MKAAAWVLLIAALLSCIVGSSLGDEENRRNSRRRKQTEPPSSALISDTQADLSSPPGGEEGEEAGVRGGAAAGHHFSPWTRWSRCTRRCRQRRRRRCVRPAACGTSMLTEERSCAGGRCGGTQDGGEGTPRRTRKGEKRRKEQQEEDEEFRILHHVSSSPYGEWGEWGACSRTACLTRRTRACRMPDVCGTKSLEESAVCYAEGSECERLHRKKTKTRKKKADTGGPPFHHPLDEGGACGVSPLSSAASIPDLWNKLRIIGGREARKGSWPWQLTILNKFREPFCGGTLLSPGWALTAAHCLRRRLIVRSGEHSLMSAEGTEQESPAAQHFPHPDYDPDTVSNDIALLRLRRPLRLDNHTRTACLPDEDGRGVGETGIILGWGKRKSTAIYGTDNLHQAEVPVVPLDECRTSYGTFPLNDRMLCAGYRAGRVDSCAGDSGGPLLARRPSDDGWAVYGVTSFGDGCGQKGKFGIYTDVSKYVKWIRRTVARYSR